MTNRMGLYNENFKMTSQEILEEKVEKIRRENARFKIIAGPLVFDGRALEKTYVLEVHYKDSEDAHTSKLPLGGFGSALCYDYMETATKLAEEFCKEKGFVINTHLNSWPIYQAVVSKE